MILRFVRTAWLCINVVATAQGVPRDIGSPPSPQEQTVSGRVLSADGNPIANAAVSLQPQKAGEGTSVRTPQEGASTRTDAEGRYRFVPQPAGRYRLQASANGYLTSLYQQHDQYSTAVVLGIGLRTSALEVRLTKNASIRGHVTDTYGDPVERANLTLYRKVTAAVADPQSETPESFQATRYRNAVTDDTGAYDFNTLPPGSYYVEATATPWYAVHPPLDIENYRGQYRSAVDPALDVAYPPLFYPHALRPEEAATLEVKGGERLIANLQMQPEHALSLSITLPPVASGQPLRSPQLFQTAFGFRQNIQQQSDISNGTMRITGLVAGTYAVEEFVPGAGLTPRGNLNISAGTTALSLADIERNSLASASVHLHDAAGGTLPVGLQVRLRNGSLDDRQPVKVDANGTADVDSLAAGVYRVEAFTQNRRLVVVGLSVNGKPSVNHQLRVAAGAGKLDVAVAVSLSTTRLTGTVRRSGEPAVGTMVVLVPAGATTAADLFRRDQSDLDGGFTLAGVVPGNYLLLAIEDGWTLPWTDATAMARYLPHAIPVTVADGARGTMPIAEAVSPQPR